ncbi:MAG: tRNA lysidine(34) synthetase TilS [Hyphomonas sp.]
MQQLAAPTVPADITESLDRLCGLAAAGPVCLAVSGGGDSMALLVLAAEWAWRRDRSLLALTVDHGLRPEAAAEARFVGETAARLGVAHRTLRWQAPLPGQARARHARHDLLAEAALAAGSRLVLTAHTADDQAETFLIRARAGSGWYGLAGIQPVSLSPAAGQGQPVFLARPLLQLSRTGLRDLLKAAGQTWIEDPSNENPAYERVRVRRRLAESPDLRTQVLAIQSKLFLLRQLQDQALARWLRTHVGAGAGGALTADAPLPSGELGERALAALISLAAGRAKPLRTDALARLTGRLRTEGEVRPATLGGAIVSRKKGLLRARPELEPAPALVNAITARLEAMGTACSGGV